MNEQICLVKASLNIFVHDAMNLLCYENLTEKREYLANIMYQFLQLILWKILKGRLVLG